MKSAMPAFKNILTEEERWDVLVYVHQNFHRGFKEIYYEAPPPAPKVYKRKAKRADPGHGSGHSH